MSNMKFERINENQIRCTLNETDLANRDLQLAELAYGTEKAKALFRDMMQQASYELGFEAEDIPLMIEAIPVNKDCLILIITKVEDPDELDTRFSRFSKPIAIDMDEAEEETEEEDYQEDDGDAEDATEDEEDSVTEEQKELTKEQEKKTETLIDFLKELDADLSASSRQKTLNEDSTHTKKETNKSTRIQGNPYRMFVFKNLNTVIQACKALNYIDKIPSKLYKNQDNNSYCLIVQYTDAISTEQYIRLSSVLIDFGKEEHNTYAVDAYLKEHYSLFIPKNAIETLAKL